MIFIACILLVIPFASAGELDGNQTMSLDDENPLEINDDSIYVDGFEGNDLNDGKSQDTSVKSISRALDLSNNNNTIFISSGNYTSDLNTKITISKSVNLVGCENTIFDGQNRDYLFTITDSCKVTFKNIKFINFYKVPSDEESVYGAVLDIKKASVDIENCTFADNLVGHNAKSAVYGGAISNFGNLTITDSVFINNTVNSAQGLNAAGGAIYNRGNLTIRNSSVLNSRSGIFSMGAGIANYAKLAIEDSEIAGSHISAESRGSAVYNAGEFTLTNSIIRNNVIEKSGIGNLYGAIYNSGNFTAVGNIFQNNAGVTDSSSVTYRGTGNIYSTGTLNLTYNAFLNDYRSNGETTEVFYDAGEIISLENNWWGTNDNPYDENRFNLDDEITSWLKFTLTPEYTPLNISDSVTLKAAFESEIGAKLNSFPILNVTFKTLSASKTESLKNGEAYFKFTETQNKGIYDVTADLYGFEVSAIVDVGKLVSRLDYNMTDNIEYLDTLKINVSVSGNNAQTPEGKVIIQIGNKKYAVDLADGEGSLELENLKPGTFDVKFTYGGSDDYFKSFANATLTIKKLPVNLTMSIPSIKIDEKSTVATVTLNTKGAQGQAVLYLNGDRKQNVYLYNGETSLTLRNLAEGQYNATLVFLGNNQYESCNVSTAFKVSKYSTVLNIYASDINAGENETILIEALPEDLRGEAILSINNVNTTIWINNTNTTVNISNLGYGRYDVGIIYRGDSKYYGANDTASFRVMRQPSELDVSVVKNDNDLNGTITVRTNPLNCTGLIGVYINYNFYSLNLTDGVAVFDVKFDSGTNYIFVYFEGDGYYEDSNWNTTIGVGDKFVFIGENSTSFEHNDFNYSVRLLELTGIPMPSRNVTFSFNGLIYYILTDEEGFAYLPLNLEKGSYSISASYQNETINNTITVSEIKFDVVANDTSYGEIQSVEISCDKDLKGQFSLVVENVADVNLTLTGSKLLYNLTGLNAGTYTASVKYFNEYYTSPTKSIQFKVKKANLNATVKFIQKEFKIIVSDLGDAVANITFIIDGITYTNITNSSQSVLFKILKGGNHTLTVKYAGDDNYNPYELNTFIFVKSLDTDVILTVNGAAYGEKITAIVNVDKNATGIVQFSIANITQNITVEDGAAQWTFSGIDAGKYTFKAEYLGDIYYLENENSTSFEITKAKSDLLIYVKEALLEENIRIYANLTANATGSVLFSMDDYYSPRYKNIRDSQANWYISPLDTGVYTVHASYDGDKNFNPSSASYILNISQKKACLEVDIADVRVVDRVIVNVNLTNRSSNPIKGVVKVNVGDKTYELEMEEGTSSLVIGRLPAGNYTYAAAFEGNSEYARATAVGNFEVRDTLLTVKIVVLNLTKYYTGDKKLIMQALTSNNRYVSNVPLHVTIEGNEYTLITDNEGIAQMDVDLNPGNYTAFVNMKEDGYYHNASANASVTILSTVEATDLVKLNGTSGQYFAIFCDAEGRMLSSKDVTFKIASKSYTVKTLPNGIVRLNINLNPGRYTITATNPVTKQVAKNSIFIFLRLMENKNLKMYYGAGKYFKVKAYNDDGNVAKNVIVKMNINGVTYKVKTNSKGYASLKIRLNPGKYKITATYKKFTVKNTVTVKSTIKTKISAVKKASKIKVKAKLVNSKGKILKSKKLTFKFHGTKYSAKTNSKGYAIVYIKNNLKPGKYLLKTKYKKLTKKDIISIK